MLLSGRTLGLFPRQGVAQPVLLFLPLKGTQLESLAGFGRGICNLGRWLCPRGGWEPRRGRVPAHGMRR